MNYTQGPHNQPSAAFPVVTAGPIVTTARSEPRPAGFWRRAVALSIDGNCILLIRSLMALAWDAAVGPVGELAGGAVGLLVVFFSTFGLMAALALTGILYYSAFEASPLRATPGKIIMQAYVGGLTGQPITFMRALGRNLAKIFSVITLGIGYLMAAFTSRKQGLHDIIAGTVVYRRGDASVGRFLLGVICALLLGAVANQVATDVQSRVSVMNAAPSQPHSTYAAPPTPAENQNIPGQEPLNRTI